MTTTQADTVSRLILVSAETRNASTRARLTKTAARLVVADAASSAMDAGQLGLDAAGFIPGIGEIADGINALVSLVRGDYMGAALSVISMIPLAGDVVGKGGKLAIWLSKMAKSPGKMGKGAQFLLKNGPKIKTTLTKFSKFVVENRKQIKAALFAVNKLVKAVSEGESSGTPAVDAISKTVAKSPKLKAIVSKAAPHLDQMNAAVSNVMQLAQASDEMFQKLEQRAQQEVGSSAVAGRG